LMPAQRNHAPHSPNFPLRLGLSQAARVFPNYDVRHESHAVSIGPATKAACQ
jgi:hypothetical protein